MADYNCFAYRKPVYGPAMRLIASITNSTAATVTTTFAHGYVDGTIVRFDIPPACGMQQIDQQTAPILVTGDTTFKVRIDTTLYAPFSVPSGLGPFINICALSVPIGENNDTLKAAVVNQLPTSIL